MSQSLKMNTNDRTVCIFILINYVKQSHFVTLHPLSHWLVWLVSATMLLIIPALMDAMVTVTWRREAVVAASVMVGITLLGLTF